MEKFISHLAKLVMCINSFIPYIEYVINANPRIVNAITFKVGLLVTVHSVLDNKVHFWMAFICGPLTNAIHSTNVYF